MICAASVKAEMPMFSLDIAMIANDKVTDVTTMILLMVSVGQSRSVAQHTTPEAQHRSTLLTHGVE